MAVEDQDQATLGDDPADDLATAAAEADAADAAGDDDGAAADGDGAGAVDGEGEDEKAKRETVYMVLSGKTETGPWDEVGTFSGTGQIAVKKDAVAKIGEKAQERYFLAIPISSYVPQKPKVKVTTLVTF
jgi:hypothetical protein